MNFRLIIIALAAAALFAQGPGGARMHRMSTQAKTTDVQSYLNLTDAQISSLQQLRQSEMAALKPQPEFLTLFYLMVSAGGATGGLFVALLAPHIFSAFYELPLALGACAVAVLIALLRQPGPSGQRLGRPAVLAAEALTLLLLALVFHVARLQGRQSLVIARNFYGVLRVGILPAAGVRPADGKENKPMVS